VAIYLFAVAISLFEVGYLPGGDDLFFFAVDHLKFSEDHV